MDSVQTFLNTKVGDFIKVFVSVVLAAFAADLAGVDTFDSVFSQWQSWVIAGLIAAVPVFVNYINPTDPRYGRGAP